MTCKEVLAESITTNRLILENVSLNGLVLQRLLSMKHTGNEDFAASINILTNSLDALSNKIDLLTSRIDAMNENNAFIEFLKTQVTIWPQ